MSETSPARMGEQDRLAPLTPGIAVADLVTLVRVPFAAAFLLVPDQRWRLVILGAAGVSDLLDGQLARRYGSSRTGPVLDPIADKLFVAAAVAVVALSGRLQPFEIVILLLRDIVATLAFATTVVSRHPRSIPARWSGKAVTLAQMVTLVAFLTGSALLRPLAWVTGAMAVFAIVDYIRVAPEAGRRLGN